MVYLFTPSCICFSLQRKPVSGLRFVRWVVRMPSDQYGAYIKFGGLVFYYRVQNYVFQQLSNYHNCYKVLLIDIIFLIYRKLEFENLILFCVCNLLLPLLKFNTKSEVKLTDCIPAQNNEFLFYYIPFSEVSSSVELYMQSTLLCHQEFIEIMKPFRNFKLNFICIKPKPQNKLVQYDGRKNF